MKVGGYGDPLWLYKRCVLQINVGGINDCTKESKGRKPLVEIRKSLSHHQTIKERGKKEWMSVVRRHQHQRGYRDISLNKGQGIGTLGKFWEVEVEVEVENSTAILSPSLQSSRIHVRSTIMLILSRKKGKKRYYFGSGLRVWNHQGFVKDWGKASGGVGGYFTHQYKSSEWAKGDQAGQVEPRIDYSQRR